MLHIPGAFAVWVTILGRVDNGILVEHFEDEFLTLPNLDFIPAHSSFITAQMAVLPPYFRPWRVGV